MQVSCQVNTKGMEAACMALAKVTGRTIEDVVMSELGRIIDRTIQLTPAATIQKIRSDYEKAEFTAQPATLYTPRTAAGLQRRAQANFTRSGKILYDLSNRYPSSLWGAITRARKESLRKRIGAIGLAKKSWWSIAQALGLPVRGGRFTNAVATTGKEYPEDVAVKKTVNDTEIAVAFINSQPTANVTGGAHALQTAINGRVKYFLKNVEKGVFDSMQSIAKSYPGLKLKP